MAKAKITESKVIKNRIVKSGLANWHEFKFLQPQNFKDISMEAHNKLKASIRNNQFVEPFKAWQNGKDIYCVDGFHRCKVMAELESEGFKISDKMPTDFLECKNKKEASKLVLIYSSIYARMSDEGLYEFLDSYKLDFDDIKLEIDLPAFDLDRFEIGYIKDASEEIEDGVPEVPKKAKSKLGDLYLLGGTHRLLCGDCTDKGMVDRLMDGKRANMVFTDPPYGVSYADKNRFLNQIDEGNRIQTPMIQDHVSEKDIMVFWKQSFEIIRDILANTNSYYIFGPQIQGMMMMMMMMMMEAGLPYKHVIVWVKNNHVLGRCDYNYKHEPMFFGWTTKHKFYKKGEFQTSVWEVDKPLKSDLHPTMKPVRIIKNALLNSSLPDQICFDGFLGSGSTLIACEKTNRVCYGMEIEPLYIDVILERYKNFTGKKVELIRGLIHEGR